MSVFREILIGNGGKVCANEANELYTLSSVIVAKMVTSELRHRSLKSNIPRGSISVGDAHFFGSECPHLVADRND